MYIIFGALFLIVATFLYLETRTYHRKKETKRMDVIRALQRKDVMDQWRKDLSGFKPTPPSGSQLQENVIPRRYKGTSSTVPGSSKPRVYNSNWDTSDSSSCSGSSSSDSGGSSCGGGGD